MTFLSESFVSEFLSYFLENLSWIYCLGKYVLEFFVFGGFVLENMSLYFLSWILCLFNFLSWIFCPNFLSWIFCPIFWKICLEFFVLENMSGLLSVLGQNVRVKMSQVKLSFGNSVRIPIYGGECPYQVWTSYNGNLKIFYI